MPPSLTSGGPATITLTQGELAITDSLTINGPGANLLTIDASGNDPTPDVNNGDGSRVFNIDDGNDVEPARRFDQRSDAHRRRRERRRRRDLHARETLIRHRQHDLGQTRPAGNGGGIHARVGNVTVTSSTIAGNSAAATAAAFVLGRQCDGHLQHDLGQLGHTAAYACAATAASAAALALAAM